jgi:hypothetical protein
LPQKASKSPERKKNKKKQKKNTKTLRQLNKKMYLCTRNREQDVRASLNSYLKSRCSSVGRAADL